MADPQQPLRTWQVSICFGEPHEAPFMAQNVVVAANAETASAMTAVGAILMGMTKKPVIGVLAQEVRPEFMRAALNGGQPGAVVPLSVVPSAPTNLPVETPVGLGDTAPFTNSVPDGAA